MILAITQRISSEPDYHEIRDCLDQQWMIFLKNTIPELSPLLIPNYPDVAKQLCRKHQPQGLLLTGGNDLGEYPERDQTERELLIWALDNNIPILGICRGMQLLATYFGAKIIPTDSQKHRVCRHLLVQNDLSPITLKLPSEVNSYHNQQVQIKPECPLKTFAKTTDGTPEGVWLPDKPVVAIQWHPERENPTQLWDRAIFRYIFLGEVL